MPTELDPERERDGEAPEGRSEAQEQAARDWVELHCVDGIALAQRKINDIVWVMPEKSVGAYLAEFEKFLGVDAAKRRSRIWQEVKNA